MTEAWSRDVIYRIADQLKRGQISSGDRAELRRMHPRDIRSGAFFLLSTSHLDAHLPPDTKSLEEQESKWAAIINGLALMVDHHVPGARLGMALAAHGFSELRFVRLLRADEDGLLDELPALARMIAAKGMNVDWDDAAQLILRDAESGERHRRNLARDYYGMKARAEAPTSS